MARAKHKRLQMVMDATRSVLPRNEQTENIRYLPEYNCFPPPFFLILISILQIGFYFFHQFSYCGGTEHFAPTKCALAQSPLILNPCKKWELWRFFSYMFVHVGFVHLLTNVAFQILLGFPLELVHKCWRIGLLYLLGVMFGALLSFVFDRDVYLAGASGGVYTFLSANIANVIINWGEMEFKWLRVTFLGVFVSSDIGVSIYQQYFASVPNKISHVTHIGGFIAGLFLGIVILRNLRKRNWENYAWWTALAIFIFFVVTCAVIVFVQELTFPAQNICKRS